MDGDIGWSWREFVRSHRRGTAITLAAVLAAIAFIVGSAILSSNSAALDDATPCSDWASASSGQQAAYARLYLSEYGPLTRAGATAVAVRAAINGACTHAALLAEADDVTVYAAIHRRY